MTNETVAPVASDSPVDGTPESDWLPWMARCGLPRHGLEYWLPAATRAVVVAPHPDDEVIGFGALLAAHARRGGAVLLLAVTDGEASHPGSKAWPPSLLSMRRQDERSEGLGHLGLPDCLVHRCGLPDGAVRSREAQLESALVAHLRPGDVVLTTWRLDGHPDHEATGCVVAQTVARTGHRVIEAPVWMWRWARPGDDRVPWSRMAGFAAAEVDTRAKRQALHAHRSQHTSDEPARPPVLGPQMMARAGRPVEWFFDNPGRP